MTRVRLKDAIKQLREELIDARDTGVGNEIAFEVGSVEVEMEVMAEEDTAVEGKLNWWVFSGGASERLKDVTKHKLKLTLTAMDAEGQPLKVASKPGARAGSQPRRG